MQKPPALRLTLQQLSSRSEHCHSLHIHIRSRNDVSKVLPLYLHLPERFCRTPAHSAQYFSYAIKTILVSTKAPLDTHYTRLFQRIIYQTVSCVLWTVAHVQFFSSCSFPKNNSLQHQMLPKITLGLHNSWRELLLRPFGTSPTNF